MFVSMKSFAIKSRNSAFYRHETWPDIQGLRVGGVENYYAGR